MGGVQLMMMAWGCCYFIDGHCGCQNMNIASASVARFTVLKGHLRRGITRHVLDSHSQGDLDAR